MINSGNAFSVSQLVIDAVNDSGYEMEDILAGLIDAVVELAEGDEELLDVAAKLLAEGGIIDEGIEAELDYWDPEMEG